jgi:hypothetical protein
MSDRRRDRPLIAMAVGVLVTITIFFIGYSYKTSDNMDRSAVSTGSSTSSSDKAMDKPATTGSNVPPATRQ